ncbi:oocyte zinc finger protein XlCOF6 [Anastrepha obliqua]|uniref:oocyte zinc finger protein XlCOF6 n=1 Tax=Anastrepha obliqua TaxID=95512 RepID=UPI0024094A09|nr:oocyte zinc finger protein XlCOF6 [Anastrepha obliqua]
MAGNGDIMDGIEPCRTCGIFYLTTSNFLRKFFDSSTDEYDLSNIRTELAAWSVQIIKDDGLPQYICTCCILEFQKMFKFRGLCVELQTQWRHFYNVRAENKLYIKKELPDPDEKTENICDFIYVDDISDNEYNGEGGGFTPFKMPHVPIKEESPDNAAGQNDSIILGAKETFNTSSNQMETSEETNFAHNISYLANSNSNSLDSQVSQLLDEPVNQLPPFEPNQEISTSVQCSLCRHMSVSAELHRQHMKRIHEIKDLVCHICGKEFKNSTATRLKFHLKWHRISKHIKCAQCGFFCDSRATLKEHTRAIHSKIECTTCGKRVLGKKMKIHMRGHKLRSWSCSYCDEVFQTENVLEAHIWQIHAQEENLSITTEENNTRNKLLAEQSSSCSQCNQFYATQYELNAHKLQCHLMPNTFDTESYASSDLQSEQFHYQDSADILQVPTTNLPITNKGTGVNEANSYTSCNDDAVTQIISSDEETCDSDSYSAASKDFACPKCTQTFSSTEQLCAHYQQHVEKSGFNCQICGKSFELKFSLNRHLKKHNSQ